MSSPHIVINHPGDVRDEITFEPPDIWHVKHVGPEHYIPGCTPPCTGRWTNYFTVTAEEVAQFGEDQKLQAPTGHYGIKHKEASDGTV